MRIDTAFILSVLVVLTAAPVHAAQTIEFPDQSIGTVFIQPDSTVNFDYETFRIYLNGWQELGPAAGSVSIPDGQAVRLKINEAAVDDTDWISKVTPDLIDDVEATGVPLGDEWFEQLTQLSGLRSLTLYRADLTSKIAVHLPRLRRLQYLWLSSNSELGDEAMKAVAGLPELQ